MRVLLVTPYYEPAIEWGGPVEAVRVLAAALSDRGVEVEVVTTIARANGEAPIPAGVSRANGVTVHRHRAPLLGRWGFAPGAWAHALDRPFDLVHVHGVWSALSVLGPALARRARPWLLSPHGALQSWGLGQRSLGKRALLASAAWLAGPHALHYASELEQRESHAVARGGEIIPWPVDTERLAGIPLADGPPTVLALARLHPVKGLDLLLPAFAEASAGRDARLLLAGPDEVHFGARLRAAAAGLGIAERVQLLGTLDREGVARALRAAHVVALPSWQESFGLAAAEGMAAGRAVLVTDRVGIADDVRRAEAGWVVPPARRALTEALVQAFTGREECIRRGARGRDWAQGHWHPAPVARAMQTLYERLAETRG